jgi:CheY-like chemotaxis protein
MKRILVVAPESVLIKSLSAYCNEEDIAICHKTSTAEALNLLFTEKFDVLVSSFNLDGMDGVQLISTLKNAHVVNSLIPCIMISSSRHAEALFELSNRPEHFLLINESTIDKLQVCLDEALSRNTFQRARVLYIEDDLFVQKVVKTWLKKVPGIEIDITPSISGISDFLENNYDIILSDNILGDGNAEDAVKKIEASNLKGTPIIVYTASIDKINVLKIKRLGNVLDVLSKPFNLQHFMKTLKIVQKNTL